MPHQHDHDHHHDLDLARTIRALTRYDAIAHDLAILPSPVLRERLAAAHIEVLAASGAATLDEARSMIPPRRHPIPAVPQPRTGQPSTTTARRTTRRSTDRGRQPAAGAARTRQSRMSTATAGDVSVPRPRTQTPLEQANLARQAAQRAEARRLSALPRSARRSGPRPACPTCGNHGKHWCRSTWRLANGEPTERPAKRSRGGSVWTVRGGLPGLGKRGR